MNNIKKIDKQKGDGNMKKITLIVLVLSVMGLISISSIADANLLSNPGFENEDPMGWSNWGDSEYVTSESMSGNQSGHAWTWNNSDGKFEQWIDVVAGLEYQASGYIKCTQMEDGAAWIQFQWDGNSAAIESTKLTTAGDWAYFETPSVEAPTGVATAKVAFILEAPSNNLSNDVFFDDANFEEVAVPEPTSLILMVTGLLGVFSIPKRR